MLTDDIKRARKILAALCEHGHVGMSIPVRQDDDDMTLKRVIDAAERAVEAGASGAAQDAKDAARYRWLRERNATFDDVGIFTADRVTRFDGTFSHNALLALEDMDAAIDEAVEAQQRGSSPIMAPPPASHVTNPSPPEVE